MTQKVPARVALALILATGAGSGIARLWTPPPKIEQVRDITGDGIQDVVAEVSGPFGTFPSKIFYIGNGDGTYTMARLKTNPDGSSYLQTDTSAKYTYDGKNYRKVTQ